MTNHRSAAGILSGNNIKPSYARIRIYDYLLEKRNHPMAEDIYLELLKAIPTLSRTTVYNTLKLFLEKGLLQLVTIEENTLRYDADTACHGHFKCLRCGRIYDFPVNPDRPDAKALNGFIIIQKSVYYSGICINCAQNQKP